MLLSSADFFKINFFQKFFQEYNVSSVSNSLDAIFYCLGPYCLQKLSVDDTRRSSKRRAYSGSEFFVANTLAKSKKLEPN